VVSETPRGAFDLRRRGLSWAGLIAGAIAGIAGYFN